MADESKKEFSEKQDMQDSRYVISLITAWSWIQSVPTRSTCMADQEVGSSGWDIETFGRGQKWLGRSKPEASEHGRYLKGERMDNKGKESNGWKIQDSLLQSLTTVEEGAGTSTDINSKDLG